MSTERLFIADLHLAPERPATTARLIHFLRTRAQHAHQLFILGDLFDAWIGDDDDAPLPQAIRAALRDLTAAGVDCALLPGNRDFLLGRAFFRDTGCRRLTEPTLLDGVDEPTLLLHGDLLCSDDVAYQRWRRYVRNPLIQRLFLWQSLAKRRTLAQHYRHRSSAATATKTAEIMDVNLATVQEYLRRFGATRIVHGHTHRPADHVWHCGGREVTRLVVAAWDEEMGGEVLVLTPDAATKWHRESVI
jgi:UDP-2,3-diacylglucosamine hydrolase